MTRRVIELGELMPGRGTSVDPAKFPEESFALFSVPAYDSQVPDRVLGKEIGSTKQVVQPGDVLLSKIVPHIRRAWIVPPSDQRRQIGSSEWIIFRSSDFHAPYLRHVLLSDQFNTQLMQTVSGVGGSLLRARPTGVAKIKIHLPIKSEQRRIAAILDKAEELRAKRRAAIALLDQLPQAIFLEMFGDPKDYVSKHRSVEMSSILDPVRGTKCGPFGSALSRAEYTDSGVPVWGIDNVDNREFKEERSLFISDRKYQALGAYDVKQGDILITRAGTVGRMCVARPQADRSIIGTNLIRVSLNFAMADPDYLVSLLTFFGRQLGNLKANGKDEAYSFMKTGVLKHLVIPLPPVDLQRLYAARIEDTKHHRAIHQSALSKADDLFASLQAQAFGGGK